MEIRWTIQLLGRLAACDGEREITRFRTRKTAELLACLALHRNRDHSRDTLLELLWPEQRLEDARNSLSVALNSLRRQFEPPGTPAGAFLLADRTHIRLPPDVCITDAERFETALNGAETAEDPAERVRRLSEAVALYSGDLLPGYDSDWILTERQRLHGLHWNVLRRLVKELTALRAYDRALDMAHRAAQCDPLHEGAARDLMRLYAALGQTGDALEVYRLLEARLRDVLETAPAETTVALARELESKRPANRDNEGKGKREKGKDASALSAEAIQNPESKIQNDPTPDSRTPTPASSTPVAPVSDGLRSLPPQITRFFGRETELAELEARLRPDSVFPARLLTLTGAGGSGKTRLAVELTRRLADAYQNALWFVALSDCRDPARLPDAVRDALRLPPSAEMEPTEQIIAFIGTRPFLLVFDNMEQLLEPPALDWRDTSAAGAEEHGGAAFVQNMLARVPALNCLITSRRILDIGGEQEISVAPFAAPQESDSPEELMQNPGVRLFVDRAQARSPDFQLTKSNSAAVAALCRQLEGIPLALELAAGWAKTLTPAQMAAQMRQRFDFLASRRHDLPQRHRTLRAAIAWSYSLLPPELQRFFARLSVFRGGWTPEAAAAVCEEPNARDYLAMLQDSSLLLTEERGEAIRFRMLESLREFARDILEEAGERIQAQDRHAAYFLDWLAPTSRKIVDGDAADALRQISLEIENARKGMDWRVQQNNLPDTIAYGQAITRYLVKRSLYAECEARLDVAAAAARRAGDKKTLASLLNRHGVIAIDRSEHAAACRYFEECGTLSKEIGEIRTALAALINLGAIAWAQSDFGAAQRVWEEALQVATDLQQTRQIGSICNDLGLLACLCGDYAASEAYFTRGLEVMRSENSQVGIANALYNHADLLWQQGAQDAALAQSRAAQEIYRAIEMPRGVALTQAQQAGFLVQTGAIEAARETAEASLSASQELGVQIGAMFALDALARVSAAQGHIETARERFRQSGLLACKLNDRRHQANLLRHYGEALALAPETRDEACRAFALAAREYAALQMPEAAAMQAQIAALGARPLSEFSLEMEAQARSQDFVALIITKNNSCDVNLIAS